MKKFLLAAALLGMTSGAFAQDGLMPFDECFALSFNGQPVEAGTTIDATHFTEADPDIYGEGYVTYESNIQMENLDIMPVYVRGVFKPYQHPTAAEYLSDRFFWGDPQLCYAIKTSAGASGNCLLGDLTNPLNPTFAADNVQVPVVGDFEWQIHVVACDKNADATYMLTLEAVSVDGTSYTPISTPFTCYLKFSEAASGVNGIEADNAAGVYYDLQGRKVANPAKGIYIYKTGDKAVKRVIK